MTFHTPMPTAACPGISWRHLLRLLLHRPNTYSTSGSMRYPKQATKPYWCFFFHKYTHTHQSSSPVVFPPSGLSPSWQKQAGEDTAPFLGTKKQLIYVYETGCLGRPFLCVCGSLPVKLTQRVRDYCCPVITTMYRMHVGNCNDSLLYVSVCVCVLLCACCLYGSKSSHGIFSDYFQTIIFLQFIRAVWHPRRE